MKKIILSLIMLCSLGFETTGQLVISSDRNAVVHSRFTRATTDTANYKNPSFAITTVQYLDGLGRPIQKVGFRHGNGGNGQDIIYEDISYDNFNRPVRTVLPTAALLGTAGRDGTYKSAADTAAILFYQDLAPYNETVEFDNSPLNRPEVMYGAGKTWRDSLRNTQLFYGLAGDEIRRYTKAPNNDVIISGTFPANSLFKNMTVDEQRDTTITFTDKRGRLVQQWVQDENGYIITSYVYDGLDRPVAIIQPQGYANGGNFAYDQQSYKNYVFAYEYDERGRIKRKHVPGGGWTSYVYDKRDQVVLEQSALQEPEDLWSFIKYDAFGRVAITGELESNRNQNSLQTDLDGVAVPFETRSVKNYDGVSFPSTMVTGKYIERQFFFYDNYDWVVPDLEFKGDYTTNGVHYQNSKGLQTGHWSSSDMNSSDSLYRAMHYDNKGRLIETHSKEPDFTGFPQNELTLIGMRHNFSGSVISEIIRYSLPSTLFEVNSFLLNNLNELTGNIYNIRDFDRLNFTTETRCTFTYDGIGRIKQKVVEPTKSYNFPTIPDYINLPPNPTTAKVETAKRAVIFNPGTLIEPQNTGTYGAYVDTLATDGTSIGLQRTDYSYHLRGGLLGVNLDGNKNPVPKIYEGDLFSYKLDYEQSGRWDGNIGRQRWQSTDTLGTQTGERSYNYVYDPAKRLKSATYLGLGNEDFSIPNMAYDKNGNITILARNGQLTDSTYGVIDQLGYGYFGNRLSTVLDVSFNPAGFGQNGSSSVYGHYPDGSLKSDASEGISLIIYDTFLRQPKEVQLSDNRKIKHFYDGGGALLKTQYLSALNDTLETWEFWGNLTLRNDTVRQLGIAEGRSILEQPEVGSGNDAFWSFEHFYQDHLGNTRVSFKDSSGHLVKTAETAFGPWGLRLNGVGSANEFQNRWELQGHEAEETFGLNRVNFGARTYNPTIGRWDRVDDYSEIAPDLSGYRYSFNDPINYIDPDGNFETRREARRYRRQNELVGRIRKDSDGNYSINNAEEGTSIFKGSEGQVHTAALIVGESPLNTASMSPAIPIGVGGGMAGGAAGSALTLPLTIVAGHLIIGADRIDQGLPAYDIPVDSYRYMRPNPGLSPGFNVYNYTPPPRNLSGFPNAKRVTRKSGRARWKNKNGDILEWDSQHGDVEVYNKQGKHKGSADPKTGKITKPPVKGRTTPK